MHNKIGFLICHFFLVNAWKQPVGSLNLISTLTNFSLQSLFTSLVDMHIYILSGHRGKVCRSEIYM